MHLPEPAHALHPPIAPFASAQVDVGDGHSVYVEQCGNPHGIPMVYLHGGPGSGCSVKHRQFFDPTRCRAVLFDQRGCGRSLPRGGLQNNTTDALLQDMETLRQQLGIARWLVVGGSWGAGLALAYAAAHPQACLGLVLRGVFLGRASDIDWFFQGAAQLLPDAWQQLNEQVPGGKDAPLLPRLHAAMQGADDSVALHCALAWEAWEQSLSEQHAIAPRGVTLRSEEAKLLVDKYRIQSHYLIHQCFREGAGLLPCASSLTTLASLPTAILHGRRDWICRPQAAWELQRQLPGSRLQWVAGCGHNPFEPGNAAALLAAIQHFASHGSFDTWGAASSQGSMP
jgi:proline iminopeptidase